MPEIHVKSGGLLTTVQDAGRIGYQKYGIAQSGVMDWMAYRMANLLVGNAPDEAVLEINYLGPELVFEEETMIAVTGAETELAINGKAVAMNESHVVPAGGSLRFVKIKRGVRAYLAFGGVIDVPAVNGSKSTFFKGHLGGFEGRQLKPKDTFQVTHLRPFKKKVLPAEFVPSLAQDVTLRVVLGPQDDAFTAEGLATFLGATPYTVTPNADRMGYRLSGPVISHVDSADIISDATVMGAVQVPKDGQPIILMADRQTTGGYTKIATVITPDLPLVAQLQTKATIRFAAVDVDEAQAIHRQTASDLARLASYLDY